MAENPLSDQAVHTYIQNGAEDRELPLIHPLLHELIGNTKGKKLLDYGCGEGKFLATLTETEVYGCDTSEAMIAQARMRVPKATLATIESGEIPLRDSWGFKPRSLVCKKFNWS